jgi:hypothetical protein
MTNLYEISFMCISKQECDDKLKSYYKKNLEEIFQNKRKEFNFEIKTFTVKDKSYNTIKSTIQLFRKINLEEINNKDKENDKEKEKKMEIKKLNYCSINKEKLYSNITFIDSIGKFLDNSFYFIKYISNKNIAKTSIGETKVIEIARCGYNMENILEELGYKESNVRNDLGFYYQYKYYPIICIYGIIEDNKHIFLQIRGYYNELNKEEILSKLDEITKLLSELFFMEN